MQTRRVPDTGSLQGRVGMESVNASRACFGMKPLPEPEPIEQDEFAYLLDLAIALLVVAILACIFGGGTEWVVAALSN